MSDKRITDLVEATQVNNNDLLVLQQSNTAKKVKGSTIVSQLNTWGEYNASTSYVVGNKVTWQGASYVCKVDCQGVAPSDTSKWMVFASSGAKIVSTVLVGQDPQGGNIYEQTFDNGATARFTAPKGDVGGVSSVNTRTGAVTGLAEQSTLDAVAGQLGNAVANCGVVQILTNGNFIDTKDWGANVGTLSVSNNIATVTATSTSNYIGLYREAYVSFIASHKYFMCCTITQTNRDATVILRGDTTTNIAENPSVQANQSTFVSGLFTAQASVTVAPSIYSSGNSGDVVKFENAMLFDLTAMGLDSITTVADFRRLFPNNYYPFTNGLGTKDEEAMMLMDGYISPVINGIGNYRSGNVYHKRIGRVDLGSLSWVTSYGYFRAVLPNAKSVGASDNANIYCNKYTTTNLNNLGNVDDGIALVADVFVYDTTYSTESAFKTAMSGVYLYYELATEQTRNIDGGEIGESIKGLGNAIGMRGWNQLVFNGDFSSGTSGWNFFGNPSVSNNILTLTKSSNSDICAYTSPGIVAGHKYFGTVSVCPSITKIFKCVIGTSHPKDFAYMFCTANTWTTLTGIATSESNTENYFQCFCEEAPSMSVQMKNLMLIDLTALFGAGNEPSSVADFRAMFPADYYGYHNNANSMADLNYTIVSTWT